ncbi:hypothetical protein BJX99DRAFT_256801 [Aspergillus californicus]
MDSSLNTAGPQAPSISSLRLYRRVFKGRKQLFAESDTAPAAYFITNPVPHKHSSFWKPVFYRGDNPKYTPTTTAIGFARRSTMWRTFSVHIGDGVQGVLENKKRRKQRRKAERANQWRARFGKEAKPVDIEEQPVHGKVVFFEMKRTGFLNRAVEWELDGVRYRWSGTRMFATGFMKGVKGWSHSMKLIRISDCALVATFEKGLLGSLKTIKTGSPPNKSKTLLGKLKLYETTTASSEHPIHTQHGQHLSLIDYVDSKSINPKDKDYVSPQGPHSGNLTEEAIAFTCWIVVEAEHRLRWKIPDILAEIAENIDGG